MQRGAMRNGPVPELTDKIKDAAARRLRPSATHHRGSQRHARLAHGRPGQSRGRGRVRRPGDHHGRPGRPRPRERLPRPRARIRPRPRPRPRPPRRSHAAPATAAPETTATAAPETSNPILLAASLAPDSITSDQLTAIHRAMFDAGNFEALFGAFADLKTDHPRGAGRHGESRRDRHGRSATARHARGRAFGQAFRASLRPPNGRPGDHHATLASLARSPRRPRGGARRAYRRFP